MTAYISVSPRLLLAACLLTAGVCCTASPDSVLIVNSLINASANVTLSVKTQSGKDAGLPHVVVVVPYDDVHLFGLPAPGLAGKQYNWMISVSAVMSPDTPTVTVPGSEFSVHPGFIRLIRIVQPTDQADNFSVLMSQSIELKNPKFHPKVDTAIILAVNDADNSTMSGSSMALYVNGTSDNCYECMMWALEGDQGVLLQNYGMFLRVDTNFGAAIDVFSSNGSRNQRTEPHYADGNIQRQFDEKAEYLLMCHGSTSGVMCRLYMTKPGIHTFAPLWHAALSLFLIGIAITVLLYLNRRYQLWLRLQCRTHDRLVNADLGDTDEYPGRYRVASTDQDTSEAGEAMAQRQQSAMNTSPSTPPRGKKPVSNRLRSLDTFRGLSLSIMIFVNYEGGRYWFFNHSRWNGLTVADCVFPWFIWIMGTSMVISFNSMRRKGVTRLAMSLKVIRRATILFCIGLLLNNGYDLSHWRIPGVLQRFGISYLVVGLVDIFVPTLDYGKGSPMYDVIAFAPQWFIMLLLVVIHTAITFGMHVPGCPTGYIGPGGIGDQYQYPNCTAGAAGYLDRLLFGPGHTYHNPTCLDTYKCQPYDPEGALGCLTSIFLCFLGCQAGRILVIYEQGVPRMTRWIVWSCILGAIGTGLCQASQNTGIIPVNKNLWSLSFILVLGACAFLLLTVCYILVDVLGVWSGAPFYFPGMNSILVYVGSELLQDYFPFSFKVSSDHSGILASSLIGVSTWMVIACYLHHIKFYLKI